MEFRIRDGFRKDIAGKRMALFSMAILTNHADGPSVLQFESKFLECSLAFQCPTVNLGQWWDRWHELEALARTNPFAVVVMAQLLAHRHKGAERLAPKTALVRLLHQYKYSRNAILSVMRLIDWMLTLPPDIEHSFTQAIRSIEQENTMAFIPSYERLAIAEGRAKGLAEGLAEGRAVGLEEGLQEGRQEGWKVGRQEGWQEGRQEGRQEGMTEGMAFILQSLLCRKFGPLPEWVEVQLKQANTDILAQWSERTLFAETLEDVFKQQH